MNVKTCLFARLLPLAMLAGAVAIPFSVAEAQSTTFDSVVVLDDHNANDATWVRFENAGELQDWSVGHRRGDFNWVKGAFGTSPTMLLRDFPTGGRLGIGTTDPQRQLHIVRDANITGIRMENNATTHELISDSAEFSVRERGVPITRPLRILSGAPTSSLVLAEGGAVGVGTVNPQSALHVRRNDGSANFLVSEVNSISEPRQLFTLENNGPIGFGMINTGLNLQWRFAAQTTGFRISLAGTGGPEFEVTNNGNVRIEGQIFTGGTSCSGGCDSVFEHEYSLEHLAQHAESMWANQHLPAVGPTEEYGRWNLTEMVGGMLHELEKAHIFVELLYEQNQSAEAELQALREQFDQLREDNAALARANSALHDRNDALTARLEQIEGAVAVLAARGEPDDEKMVAARAPH